MHLLQTLAPSPAALIVKNKETPALWHAVATGVTSCSVPWVSSTCHPPQSPLPGDVHVSGLHIPPKTSFQPRHRAPLCPCLPVAATASERHPEGFPPSGECHTQGGALRAPQSHHGADWPHLCISSSPGPLKGQKRTQSPAPQRGDTRRDVRRKTSTAQEVGWTSDCEYQGD